MTNKFDHDFTDYFQNDHVCLPQGEAIMAELLGEDGPVSTDIPADTLSEGVLRSFDAQVGAFLRGYLIGHNGSADFDDMLVVVIKNICPVCLQHWAQKRDECCLGHALMHFIEQVYPDSMLSVVATSAVPSHGDPSLN